MDPKDVKLSSFDIGFSIVSTTFLFAAIFELCGDFIALMFSPRGQFSGFGDPMPLFITLIASWILTLGILIWILPNFFRTKEMRISIYVGIICSFIIVPLVTRLIGFDFLFGKGVFDIVKDYITIFRNLVMGGFVIVMLRRREAQHKAQQGAKQ